MRKILLNKLEIKRFYLKEKMTMREISKIFNISTFPISQIIKRFGIKRKNQIIRNPKKYIIKRIVINKKCWDYPYSVQNSGYARINNNLAHRFSYEAFKRKIPKGMTIDHLCKNKICVNPDHLEVVTIQENLKRGNSPPAVNSRKTHCIKGHPLYGKNLAIYANKRQCRKCFYIRGRKSYEKRIKSCHSAVSL